VQWLVGAVIAAGAVAGAISAILALVSSNPPAALGAHLEVGMDRNITLQDYNIRQGNESASALRGVAASRLAADVMVQNEDETTTSGPSGANGPQGDIVQQTPLSEEDSNDLNGGLDQALDASPTDVGAACEVALTDPGCGLRSIATYLLKPHSEVTPQTVADQVLKVFDDLRTALPPEEGQPIGVTVNANVSLTGFAGRTAEIRWSLYRVEGGGGGSVPLNWVRGQSVLEVAAEAQEDSGIGSFWVPLPREEGPYKVRVFVYDENGTQLAYADTPPTNTSGANILEAQ
jgi:hypothetical protein